MKKHIRKIIGFKYPKLLIFSLFIIFAYLIFRNEAVAGYFSGLEDNYMGLFIAGVLFAFGFTSPFAVGIFIVSEPSNILIAAIVGGIGSVLANMLVFNLIKDAFSDELRNLEKTKIVRGMENAFELKLHHKISHYLLYAFAGLALASPLPDEIALTMLAGLTHIKKNLFIIVSLVLHVLGIYLLLLL